MEQQEQSLRADIYLLIAALLRDAPDADLLAWLSSLEIDNETSSMSSAWYSVVRSAAHHNDAINGVELLAEEYQDLFIGVGRGEVVPFGSWHMSGALMEKPLSELRHHLKQLGIERNDGVKEPEDHMSALCEVMAILIADTQTDASVKPLQKAFFNQHINPWFGSLTKQINEASSAQFYCSVAELIFNFMTLESVGFTENPIHTSKPPVINVKNVVDTSYE
nr:molecular chaperone TorD family protein [Vibrio sp. 10N.286.49.B3]